MIVNSLGSIEDLQGEYSVFFSAATRVSRNAPLELREKLLRLIHDQADFIDFPRKHVR